MNVPIIKRIPGTVPRFEKEKDGYVCLTEKSRTELLDLLQREEKLLQNQKFLNKLPDKGEKINKFYASIKEELRKREEHEDLCFALSKLNVLETKNALDRLEWTGLYEENNINLSEEDETNPLKILTTHSSSNASKQKNIKFMTDEQSTNLPHIDPYASDLVDRIDSHCGSNAQKKFYTHKIVEKASKKEEISDANSFPAQNMKTAPVVLNSKETKMLSLQDSIVIQQKQNKLLNEIEMQLAVERLRDGIDIKIKNLSSPPSNYRIPVADSDDEIEKSTDSDENYEDEDADADAC